MKTDSQSILFTYLVIGSFHFQMSNKEILSFSVLKKIIKISKNIKKLTKISLFCEKLTYEAKSANQWKKGMDRRKEGTYVRILLGVIFN